MGGASAVVRVERAVDARRGWLDQRAPGNLVQRTRAQEGVRALGGRRFDAQQEGAGLVLDGGPWRAGYYLFSIHVVPSASRTRSELEVTFDNGDPPARFGLAATQHGPVFRIVHLPSAACSLRLLPVDAPGAFELRSVRFFRVPAAFAERRMRQRVRALQQVFTGHSALSGAAAASTSERLRSEYAQTFPKAPSRGDYAAWRALREGPECDAAAEPVASAEALHPQPRVSVLVPVCDPDPAHLRECIASVLTQRYPDVQLCLVDDASRSAEVRAILADAATADPRVRVHFRKERGHISRATNDALALADGELVAFLDHDDRLAPGALRVMAAALTERPDAILAYSDEDKLDPAGERRDPHFKSRFNPELLLAQNYIGHLVVARANAVRDVGGLREGYEGSQDHDLLLRLTDTATCAQVLHVPRVLYHWREAPGSTAAAALAKPYAAAAGRRAVADALRRRGIPGVVTDASAVRHAYRVLPALPADTPLVSIIMPTRDGGAVLARAVESVLTRTRYPRLELVLVDNGSQTAETLDVLAQAASDPRVRVARDDSPFNFSSLNNRAVARSRGEVVALLNDDVEVLDGDWLTEMVSLALRPEVGCVGAKLLYPDNTVQHAGVILGIGGVAGHAHKRFPAAHHGYFGRLHLVHALSAVTAACLVVRRSTYDRVGGLDEALAVAFNDVDFCLRVRATGLRNVFTPYAVLLHHESATRGSDMAPERRMRFEREVRLMQARWRDALADDPYYSPHLTRDHEDFSIAAAS